MTASYALADVAALIGEPTRAAMLLALLDGRALPANELARAAQLSAPATSLHLAKLVRGGLLVARREGRHRYYRLANPEVAHTLEALGVVATNPAPPSRPLSPERAALRHARTCYDHLAGEVSVAVAERLERGRLLSIVDDHAWEVTDEGARFFDRELDLDVEALAHARRYLARRCLDWTERRPHLGGALGAALLEKFLERRWIAKRDGTRVVRITPQGERALEAFAR